MTIAGTLTPLSAQQTKSYNQDLDQLRTSSENTTLWRGALYLFENNFFLVDLVMFIPIVGPIWGSLAMYNTGLAVSAESTNTTLDPGHWSATLLILAEFISPHAWLEFIAYATAFAASIWLLLSIIRGGAKREIKRTGMFILICAGLLLLAAFIEEYLILTLR
jgi:uncharacterized membrane protein SpoIIM required for sporulation